MPRSGRYRGRLRSVLILQLAIVTKLQPVLVEIVMGIDYRVDWGGAMSPAFLIGGNNICLSLCPTPYFWLWRLVLLSFCKKMCQFK